MVVRAADDASTKFSVASSTIYSSVSAGFYAEYSMPSRTHCSVKHHVSHIPSIERQIPKTYDTYPIGMLNAEQGIVGQISIDDVGSACFFGTYFPERSHQAFVDTSNIHGVSTHIFTWTDTLITWKSFHGEH